MEQKAYLTLADGQVFEGKAFGAVGEAVGELVFTTAVTGYLEALTDPSYHGLIVMQTFPLVGNYGIIPEDFESKCTHVKAYIVKEWCQEPSNFRSEGDLDAFLKARNIVGLYGVDTRRLTKIIREQGVMNVRISSQPAAAEELKALAGHRVENAVAAVSCTQRYDLTSPRSRYRVVLWDFGAKKSLAKELQKRGCDVIVVPHTATSEEIKDMNPDGILLSGGPGDPADNPGVIREIGELCRAKLPTMAVGLGHQMMALSQGGKTEKMKCGHRGANQPVAEQGTSRVYITGQNHGYVVAADGLPANANANFVNANDGTVEGLAYADMPAFSVQFHPGICGGPTDTEFLFDRFAGLMRSSRKQA